jgi:release factor glutamine methyltransferase
VIFIGKQINFYLDDQIKKSIIERLRTAGCVFAEEEAQLLISEAPTLDALFTIVNLRITGTPLEHVLGWAEFCGIRLAVDRGVFVPRRRTEFLVEMAVAFSIPGAIVVDLCCGTGGVGVAIAKALGWVELYAVDIDPTAVRCALRNVTSLGGQVYEGDLFAPLPAQLRGRVDILVANAPYVPTEAIELLPQDARLHEPKVALDGGEDGLDIQRRVAEEASLWLASGGHLFLETSEMQAPQTMEIVAQYGLIPQLTHYEELDATIVIGTKPNQLE